MTNLIKNEEIIKRLDDSKEIKLLQEFSDLDNESYADLKAIRRECRVSSVYVAYKSDYSKVTIPYDFDKNRYYIDEKEIRFYDNKEYLVNKLDDFCKDPLFNIEDIYELSGCSRFCSFCLQLVYYVVIYSIVLYIMFLILLKAFCNLGLIILFIYILIQIKTLSDKYKFYIKENLKKKKILNTLIKENKTKFCIENKISWHLGESGYWIEFRKLRISI